MRIMMMMRGRRNISLTQLISHKIPSLGRDGRWKTTNVRRRSLWWDVGRWIVRRNFQRSRCLWMHCRNRLSRGQKRRDIIGKLLNLIGKKIITTVSTSHLLSEVRNTSCEGLYLINHIIQGGSMRIS